MSQGSVKDRKVHLRSQQVAGIGLQDLVTFNEENSNRLREYTCLETVFQR